MAVRWFRSKADAPSEDELQISGAIVGPSDGPSPVALVDAGHAAHGLGVVRDQYTRKIRKTRPSVWSRAPSWWTVTDCDSPCPTT